MSIGKRIQSARKAKGLTQKELAAAVGLVTGTIQQYELNKREPRMEQLQRIADALEIPLYELIDGGFGALNSVLPPNIQGINLDGAKIDERFLANMIDQLSILNQQSDEYQLVYDNIFAIADSSGLTARAYELLKIRRLFDPVSAGSKNIIVSTTPGNPELATLMEKYKAGTITDEEVKRFGELSMQENEAYRDNYPAIKQRIADMRHRIKHQKEIDVILNALNNATPEEEECLVKVLFALLDNNKPVDPEQSE